MKKVNSLLLLLLVVALFFSGCTKSSPSIGNIVDANLSKKYSTGRGDISIVKVETAFSITPSLSNEKYSCENKNNTLLAIEMDISNLTKGSISSGELLSATATDIKLREFEALTYIETENYTKLETNAELKKGEDYIAHTVFEIPKMDAEYRISIKSGSKTVVVFNYVYEDKACLTDIEVIANRYKKIGDYEKAYKIMKKNSDLFSKSDIYFFKGLTFEKYGDLGNALKYFSLSGGNDIETQNKIAEVSEITSKYDGEYKYQYRSRRYSYIYIKDGFALVSENEIEEGQRKYNLTLVEKDNRFYLIDKKSEPKEINDKKLEFQLMLNTENIGNKLRVIVMGKSSSLMYNGSFEEIKQ